MNTSPIAIDLLEAIERYIEESSKKEYRFEYEEQRKIENAIQRLNNQLDILVDYEIKRNKEKEN